MRRKYFAGLPNGGGRSLRQRSIRRNALRAGGVCAFIGGRCQEPGPRAKLLSLAFAPASSSSPPGAVLGPVAGVEEIRVGALIGAPPGRDSSRLRAFGRRQYAPPLGVFRPGCLVETQDSVVEDRLDPGYSGTLGSGEQTELLQKNANIGIQPRYAPVMGSWPRGSSQVGLQGARVNPPCRPPDAHVRTAKWRTGGDERLACDRYAVAH